MKKYLLKFSALLILAVSLVSCEEDRVMYDAAKYPALSAFVTTSGLLGCTPSKNTRYIDVEVSTLSTSVRAISYTIVSEETTADPSEYSIDAAPVIKGDSITYVGRIKVTSNYYNPALTQAENLAKPEKKLTIKLVSVDGAVIEKNESKFTLTIFNTCDFAGLPASPKYTATVTVNPVQTAFPPEFDPVLIPTGKPNEYKVNSLWGPDFVYTIAGGNNVTKGQYPAPGIIKINDDLSLTITPDDIFVSPVSGKYDPCKNEFTYVLGQTLFSTSPFTVYVTWKPKL